MNTVEYAKLLSDVLFLLCPSFLSNTVEVQDTSMPSLFLCFMFKLDCVVQSTWCCSAAV